MNRVVEDRLLIDDCEKAFEVLGIALKGNPDGKPVTEMLEKIKKHREKFTRRVLDKQAYIRKNKHLFDVIYKHDRQPGSIYKHDRQPGSIECEIKIQADLVGGGFYSANTWRRDIIRSLMTTYEKMFNLKKE
jgi:hypothetical protein